MAKNKTTQTDASVAAYIGGIANQKRREDCSALIDIMAEATGLEPKMWGAAIVGFGLYHYKYDSGHEGTAPLAGLASRANAISLYLAPDFDQKDELLSKFGKHKTGKGCIYIAKLEDINTAILAQMTQNSVRKIKAQYPD